MCVKKGARLTVSGNLLQVLQSEHVVTASGRDDCSDAWDTNSAAGSPGQEVLWEEECCSNLIMNIREAKDDPLPPAVLDGGMLLGCLRPFPCTEVEGWGTVCIMQARLTSTQKECEHQRFGCKIWSVPEVTYFWTWHITVVYRKVEPGWLDHMSWCAWVVPVYSSFSGAVNSSPFYSWKCPDLYGKWHGHTLWHSVWGSAAFLHVTSEKWTCLSELQLPHLPHRA